jgi:hydroxyacylglutathione hydrolase
MRIWTTSSGYEIIQVLAGRSNVFLLLNKEKNILIDTSPKFMWKILQNRLRQLKINKIDYLILTHTHFDHAANSKRIKEKYNAQVIVHKNEAEYLTNGDNIIPQGTNPLSKTLVRLFAKQYSSLAKYEPCQFDLSVDSTFNLHDLGFKAKIMHTPGHTPGSMSVIIDDEVALVGDTMFGVFWWTIYPPFANDTAQMINSWGKLLQTNSKVFIPSHGSANSRSLVEIDYKKRTAAKIKLDG